MSNDLEMLQYPIGRFRKPDTFTDGSIHEWISTLKIIPSWMDACIENLDHDQLQTPYRDGGWTVNQVVHHVADSHMNFFVRLKLALTENNPIVKPYEEKLWAELADTQFTPVNVSVTMLHTIHIRMVALMQHMQDADWVRTFHHPEQNRDIPLWEITAMYAWHGRHHVEQIMRLRERMGW